MNKNAHLLILSKLVGKWKDCLSVSTSSGMCYLDVTVNKFLNFSTPCFPHQSNEDNSSAPLIGAKIKGDNTCAVPGT